MLTFALLLITCLSSALAAENKREGYSYLGVGVSSGDYTEQDDDLLGTGITLKTEAPVSALEQRSGGYVAHDSGWGFYIQTEATLGTNVNNESWALDGTQVQEDSFSFSKSELRVLISRQLTGRHAFLFGAGTQDISFTRFDWRLSEQDQYQIEATEGSVSEQLFKIYLYSGLEWGHFFSSGEESGLNWQTQLVVGLPVYSQIINTSYGDDPINGGMDGYRVDASGQLAYRMNKNLMIGFSTRVTYEYQQEIETGSIQLGDSHIKRALPENTLFMLNPSLTFYWSF